MGDNLNAKNPCNEVLPASDGKGALYLGSFQALSETNIAKYKISHGVQTAKNLESFFAGWGKKLAEIEKKGAVELLRLHWVDGDQKLWEQTKWDTLVVAIKFIDQQRSAGNNVLVNCAQGKSRSSTVVVAYLMAENNLSVADALALTKSKRAIA